MIIPKLKFEELLKKYEKIPSNINICGILLQIAAIWGIIIRLRDLLNTGGYKSDS